MMAASELAVALGMFPDRDSGRLASLIASVGPLPPWPNASPLRLIDAMRADKKTRSGRLRFVLPEKIGKVRCGVEADPQVLSEVLRECATVSLRK
jgi:3-dehydroquinate synthetase